MYHYWQKIRDKPCFEHKFNIGDTNNKNILFQHSTMEHDMLHAVPQWHSDNLAQQNSQKTH